MPDKAFHFVDVTQADRASRRQARRFVMTGKNAGKRLHRPSRLHVSGGGQVRCRRDESVVAAELSAPSTCRQGFESDTLARGSVKSTQDFRTSLSTLATTSSGSRLVVGRGVGSVFRTISLPVELTPGALEIVHVFFEHMTDRLFPQRLGVSMEYVKSTWLRTTFADESVVPCNIALMQACNEMFPSNNRSSLKSLHYHSLTLSHARKRLQGADALSDGTIAMVLSLTKQELLRGDLVGARVHMDGVRRMIELRGGVSKFEENMPLMVNICKADLLVAQQLGSSPHFFRDRFHEVRLTLAARGAPMPRTTPAKPPGRCRISNPLLRGVLSDVLDVCALFNTKNIPPGAVETELYMDLQFSVQYRLGHFYSLGDPWTGSDVDLVYHLGLTIFMMTTYMQLSRHRMLDFDLLRERFRQALASLGNYDEEHADGRLLWLMAVGGIWFFGDVVEREILEGLRRESSRTRISSWDEARCVLREFPWIDSLHDQPGSSLWRRAMADARLLPA